MKYSILWLLINITRDECEDEEEEEEEEEENEMRIVLKSNVK